jgi:hypothetical protein
LLERALSILDMVGAKNIFVLSVLGIQSSGKSTLLNTMFGLQFAVSAGRCTRGVFIQLIPWPGEDGKSTRTLRSYIYEGKLSWRDLSYTLKAFS